MLSEKMRVSELASSAFFHLFLTISLLCYFELFPVTGAGISLFLRLRIRESTTVSDSASDVAANIGWYEKYEFPCQRKSPVLLCL